MKTTPFPHGLLAAGFTLAIVLAAGCDSAVEPVLLTWEADLVSTPPAGITGSVAVATQSGRTDAAVQISGGEPDSTYGWRINRGTCVAEAAVVGGNAVYPDLETSTQGSASAETTFAELLTADEDYAARVLDGTAAVVACAELVPVT